MLKLIYSQFIKEMIFFSEDRIHRCLVIFLPAVLSLFCLLFSDVSMNKAFAKTLYLFTAYDGSQSKGILEYDVKLLKKCLDTAKQQNEFGYQIEYKNVDLSNSDMNEDSLVKELNDFVMNCNEEDVIWVYFSCHGDYTISIQGNIKKSTYYLNAKDPFKLYNRTTILDVLDKSKAGLILFMSDACNYISTNETKNETKNESDSTTNAGNKSTFSPDPEKLLEAVNKYTVNEDFKKRLEKLFSKKGFYDMYAASRGEATVMPPDDFSIYIKAFMNLLNKKNKNSEVYDSWEIFLAQLKKDIYKISEGSFCSTYHNFRPSRKAAPYMFNPKYELEDKNPMYKESTVYFYGSLSRTMGKRWNK